MDIIKLVNISKYYENGNSKIHALENINLTFKRNELVAIIGRSGCGKSTLINILAGLTTPTSGSCYFEGKELDFRRKDKLSKYRRKNIGMVVQNFALIGNMTVAQNIGLPITGKPSKSTRQQIKKLANDLGIAEKLDCYPYQLSGGECQRVAIARALIIQPKIILADEPTGALDNENAENIMALLKKLTDTTTVILVTHDMNIARQCDRIITLSYGSISNIS